MAIVVTPGESLRCVWPLVLGEPEQTCPLSLTTHIFPSITQQFSEKAVTQNASVLIESLTEQNWAGGCWEAAYRLHTHKCLIKWRLKICISSRIPTAAGRGLRPLKPFLFFQVSIRKVYKLQKTKLISFYYFPVIYINIHLCLHKPLLNSGAYIC